jgi:nucleoside-diphosphate-sugar epimerase
LNGTKNEKKGFKMNVLVTGGTGFTGSALVLRLLDEGHKVRSLDYQKGIVYGHLKKAGTGLVTGSITDAELVDETMQGIDFVFHLAAAFRELNVTEEHYRNVNVMGTRYVMNAAKKHEVKKVVYCSTQGVHGHITDPPGDENSPIAPEDYYQKTKYDGELVVKEFMENGMNATIIRPTSTYGPGDPGRFLMIFKWVNKGIFPMFGNGKTLNHPVYIDNLVDAFISTMEPKKGSGETYLIGDQDYLTIEELVQKAGKALNKDVKMIHCPIMPVLIVSHICEKLCKPFKISPPLFPRRVDWYRQVRAYSMEKANKELDYNPIIGIDEGLRRTAEWYKKVGYLN